MYVLPRIYVINLLKMNTEHIISTIADVTWYKTVACNSTFGDLENRSYQFPTWIVWNTCIYLRFVVVVVVVVVLLLLHILLLPLLLILPPPLLLILLLLLFVFVLVMLDIVDMEERSSDRNS